MWELTVFKELQNQQDIKVRMIVKEMAANSYATFMKDILRMISDIILMLEEPCIEIKNRFETITISGYDILAIFFIAVIIIICTI